MCADDGRKDMRKCADDDAWIGGCTGRWHRQNAWVYVGYARVWINECASKKERALTLMVQQAQAADCASSWSNADR